MITMAEEHKPKNIMSFFCVSVYLGSPERCSRCVQCVCTDDGPYYIYTQYYYVTVSKVYDGLYRKVETEEE